MFFASWLRNQKRHSSPRKRPNFRPTLEALEDRWLPSTLTVMNDLDSGAGSLRAEIAAAHAGDTIVFAPSLVGQTITLTSGELLIDHNLTIAGPGAGKLTVSGNHASRVFEVDPKSGHSVTLSGLTIANGNAGISIGGGILNVATTLTVSNCTLTGNSATDGGGIDNVGGTLTVNNCTLSGNSADYGGGIFRDTVGTTTVSGSTLTGNSATDGGGGIYAKVATFTVSGSTLTGNSATDGGGIFIEAGTLTVNHTSSITGNTAPAGFGADVYNLGVLYLDASSIIGILNGNPAIRI